MDKKIVDQLGNSRLLSCNVCKEMFVADLASPVVIKCPNCGGVNIGLVKSINENSGDIRVNIEDVEKIKLKEGNSQTLTEFMESRRQETPERKCKDDFTLRLFRTGVAKLFNVPFEGVTFEYQGERLYAKSAEIDFRNSSPVLKINLTDRYED